MHSYSNQKNGSNYRPVGTTNNNCNYLPDNRNPLQAKIINGKGVVQGMFRNAFNTGKKYAKQLIVTAFDQLPQIPVPIPPQQLQQFVAPQENAIVPYQPPQNNMVPYQPPVENNAPPKHHKPKKIRKFLFKPGSFTSEMFAGLKGYTTHYFFGPNIVVFTPTDQARIYFDLELHRLLSQGIVPRWCHQLIFQNAMQAMAGNKLPMDAAKYMIKALETFGLAAMNNEKPTKLLALYTRFQLGSVPLFLAGGSSYAPAVMHFLGMMLQSMPIVLLGRRWVLRPAKGPAFRGINLEKTAKKDVDAEGKGPKK
ncbi:hypothetical protein VRU48_05220 [Pedobacter sp. KR3-3]|uniref:Uncharacterized protein n=1 Tax=Pedobacter albus TaxID=3113905 RepID=A0ABU7I4Z4_9SPHI|nr:hypothetical protein [Pedobacter sp. KR3-3]MEE1944498.1 hypothetical protein [Pedobacter sp. KR3-3]